MIKKIFLLLFVSAFAFAQQDSVAIRFSKKIEKQNLEKNLRVLASDEYEGRETGEKGQKMAAKYIAEQFQSFGIPPYKENTYYQEYPIVLQYPGTNQIIINGKKYIQNEDFFIMPGQPDQIIESASILFLGYGINDSLYNDYVQADAKDKILLVLDGEPYDSEKKSLVTGKAEPSLWTLYSRNKSFEAQKAGAKAVMVILDDFKAELTENKHYLEKPILTDNKKSTRRAPMIYISKQMGNELLKKTNGDKIKKKISATRKTIQKEVKAATTITLKAPTQNITSENVLGYIEGTDLKEELIIITAHYDHLGKEDSVVYNGADDDGSGTVAVIELAKAFAEAKKQGKGPRRSILFMPVSGEEKGLLGSAYYVNNPVYPLKNTVCNLNIDMIGRMDKDHENNPDYVYLIGSDKLSSELHAISEKVNETYSQLELDYKYNDEKDKNRFYYRSDHYNFAKNNIPVIFYFNGVHEDYHKETDEVEKIHFGKIEKITKLVFFTAWDLANRNERVKVDSNKK